MGIVRSPQIRHANVPARKSRSFPARGDHSHWPCHNTEEWFDPRHDGVILIQDHGLSPGLVHPVSTHEVAERILDLPPKFCTLFDRVCLGSRKIKLTENNLFGLHWGSTVYLYPICESLTYEAEIKPSESAIRETRMYGGKWTQLQDTVWVLTWTPRTIKDFYLNNILIHEIGHAVDTRNTGHVARERFADWFAIEYGYRATGGAASRRRVKTKRRHHSC